MQITLAQIRLSLINGSDTSPQFRVHMKTEKYCLRLIHINILMAFTFALVVTHTRWLDSMRAFGTMQNHCEIKKFPSVGKLSISADNHYRYGGGALLHSICGNDGNSLSSSIHIEPMSMLN